MGTRLHNTVLVTFREMRFLFIACLAVTVSAAPQANFGKKIEVNERLGLLANDLGLDPTAETSQSAALTAETSAGASGQLPSGRAPVATKTEAASPVAYAYAAPYAYAVPHTGCVNSVGSVVPCAV